ncbi:MAG: alpha/beta hydrolase, partial [Deltaproteobacteria bacterium]
MSRGGLIIINWALANPEKVNGIYGDAPVLDFKSWPGGKGTGKGGGGAWGKCINAYGFKTEAEALTYKGNPTDQAAALAKTNIPVLIVYGKTDNVVPPAENCLLFEKNFKAAGGNITLIGKENCGHHPHSLKDPKPIVDFVLKHTGAN